MNIYQFLTNAGVAYVKHEHPAVFTVEETSRLVPELPRREKLPRRNYQPCQTPPFPLEIRIRCGR